MNEFIKGKIPIKKFITHHNKNFICYCEIVIHPDGDIEYAIPSHQETLIRITGIDRDVLRDTLSIKCDMMKELCNITNCVSVWYNYYITPDFITKEQLHSLKLLKQEKCINFNI